MIDSEHADEKPSRAAKIIRLSGFIATGLSILTFLLTFVALTPPSPYQPLLWICVAAWLVLVVLWPPLQLSSAAPRWNRWTVPAIGVLILALGLSSVPLQLAFLVSRGDMNRIADEVMSGKRDPSKIHWIGVYPVSYAYGDHYGFWFSVRGSNTRFPDCRGNYDYTADSGFVFSKKESWLAREAATSLSHRGGHWFSYGAYCGGGA